MVFNKLFSFILFLFPGLLFGQIVEGKLSIKEIDSQKHEKLLMGNIFFHKQEEVIIYDLIFPEKISIFFFKNKLVVFEQDSLVFQTDEFSTETSVFHNLFYNSPLTEVLLQNGFSLVDASINDQKEDILVFESSDKKIKLLTKFFDKSLNSVVTLQHNNVVEKIIINKYVKVNTINLPTEFFKINSRNKVELKQWVTITDYKLVSKSDRFDLLYNLL